MITDKFDLKGDIGAEGVRDALAAICEAGNLKIVALSGGVFQNELLLEDLKGLLESEKLQIWTNHAVPPNDGGISLGQAALAAFGQSDQNARGELCTNSRSQ